ncbi:MAG TPA: hypothetical protein VIV14_08775 [Gammaproteobacteria bacterium]
MEKLNEGDPFPRMTLELSGGSRLTLPDEISTLYQVVLFYRGHW